MSAIWGYLSKSGPVSEQTAAAMLKPFQEKCRLDRIHTECREQVLFGCGLQYITAEAHAETMPIYDKANGCLFTADCILDNRDELLTELSITDSNTPDGSIMYQAFLTWGMDCLKHFYGLFSMAVYEFRTGTLYIAVDQTASRCLYYHRTANGISFSTLLAPIHALYSDMKVNENYIRDFLTAPGLMPNVVPGETPYSGIYQLKPGCYIAFNASGCQETRYWTPADDVADYRFHSAGEYAAEFRKLYASCVRDALRTCGQVGISLSSGLDSASVGALAALELQKKQQSLFSFTYVPYEKPDRPRYRYQYNDETVEVQKLVTMYPNILPEFTTNSGRNCMCELPELIHTMEIPFKAVTNLPSLLEIYRRAAQKDCRVLLSGQYGNTTISYGMIDPILYDLYRRRKYITYLRGLNNYCLLARESRKKAFVYCCKYFHYATKEYGADRPIQRPELGFFLNDAVWEDYPWEDRYAYIESIMKNPQLPAPSERYHSELQLDSAMTYIGSYETKLGLSTGILIRDPTRDRRILSFCHAIPYEYFAYHGNPRWLIRGALHDLLPSSFVDTWPRYGVQNSDWHLRIKRDWQVTANTFASISECRPLKPYLNTDKLTQFLRDFSSAEKITPPLEEKLQELSYLCALSAFYRDAFPSFF